MDKGETDFALHSCDDLRDPNSGGVCSVHRWGKTIRSFFTILIERTVGFNLGPSEEDVEYGADAPPAIWQSV